MVERIVIKEKGILRADVDCSLFKVSGPEDELVVVQAVDDERIRLVVQPVVIEELRNERETQSQAQKRHGSERILPPDDSA